LRRRAVIYAGDTIVVGKNAFIQIRFTDGGLFSLRPDSEFKVSTYRYQEQESENGKMVLELLKGGLRTISGSIGKKNKDNYQLKTPISTIGIRGTHYGLRLCAGDCASAQGGSMPDGLYGGVVDGAISVDNQSGEGIVGNDQYFHVAAIDAPLKFLLGPPGIVFDPAVNGVLQNDSSSQKNKSRSRNRAPLRSVPLSKRTALLHDGPTLPVIPDKPLDPLDAQSPKQATKLTPAPLGSKAVMALNHAKFGADAMIAAQKDLKNPEIFIDVNNNLIGVEHNSTDCQSCGLRKGNAVLSNDGMPMGGFNILGDPNQKIYWGRWIGGWYGKDGEGSHIGQGNWHFMYSPNVTEDGDLNNLHTSEVTATFKQISSGDGTLPTDEAGKIGHFTALTTLNVDFGKHRISGYTVSVGFSATGRNFIGTQQATVVPFSGSGAEFDLDVTTCSLGCSPSMAVGGGVGRSNIIFVGKNASHIINSFQMQSADGINSAVGTVHLLKKP